jgi:hypothetical protein
VGMDVDGIVMLIVLLLFVVGGIAAGGIVGFIVRGRAGDGGMLPWRFLLRVYLYLALIASLMVTVGGLAELVRAALAVALGEGFSYYPSYPTPAPAPDTPLVPEEGLRRALWEGVLRGITSCGIGSLVLGAHLWVRRRLEVPGEGRDVLGRAYLVFLLLIFSVLVLVTLPFALYHTLRFFLLDARDVRPGEPLARALTVLPLWVWLLYRAVGVLRGEGQAQGG